MGGLAVAKVHHCKDPRVRVRDRDIKDRVRVRNFAMADLSDSGQESLQLLSFLYMRTQFLWFNDGMIRQCCNCLQVPADNAQNHTGALDVGARNHHEDNVIQQVNMFFCM